MKRSRRAFLAGLAIVAGLRPRRGHAPPSIAPFTGALAVRSAAWLGRRCRFRVAPIRRPEPATAEAIRAAVRADFAAGRTVVVDGWLLAAAEATLYERMAALTRGSPDA
jgi:hypothetical protein